MDTLLVILDYIYWHLNKENSMTEPERIPLDPTTPKAPSVKKIPLPNLETEFFQMIADVKREKEERESNAN